MTSKDKCRPVPARLIEARKSNGLSTGKAAEVLHLTRAGISQYETGKSAPAWPILKMLALTYHTSVAWLCGETDEPEPDQIITDSDDRRAIRLLGWFQELDDADKDLVEELMKRLLEDSSGAED